MGATGPVAVEQLIMRGTIEETLHRMVHGDDGADLHAGSATADVVVDNACRPCEDASDPVLRTAGAGAAASSDAIYASGSAPVSSEPSTPTRCAAADPEVQARRDGKRRMADVDQQAPATQVSSKRSRMHQSEQCTEALSHAPTVDDAAALPSSAPGRPRPQQQDEAKVHFLLRSMRFAVAA